MDNATPDEKPAQAAPKPVNWYSGWRLLATSAVTVLAVKLIGLLGAAIALLAFFWLQPKRGTGLAVAAAVIAGLSVAVASSVVLQSTIRGQKSWQFSKQSSQHTEASNQGDLQFDPSTAQKVEPAQSVSPSNPFTDPNYGKDLAAQSTQIPTAQPSPMPPAAQQSATSAQEVHMQRIYAAHPDADAVFKSAEFHRWLTRTPRFKDTPTQGSTQEIIDMFTAFKHRPLAESKRLDQEAMRRNEAAAEALARQYAPTYSR